MILAAGEGRRMLPLTQSIPKPLLQIKGVSLIERQIMSLRDAGIRECIINVSYLGEKIIQALGDGSDYGVKIDYSLEDKPLETGGALVKAMPLLGNEPFLLVNADVYTQYNYSLLVSKALAGMEGHLVLVDNPAHNAAGDFALDNSGCVRLAENNSGLTFSGISILQPSLILTYPQKRKAFALREVFDYAIKNEQLSGEYFDGNWVDVGTPERLAHLQQAY